MSIKKELKDAVSAVLWGTLIIFGVALYLGIQCDTMCEISRVFQ